MELGEKLDLKRVHIVDSLKIIFHEQVCKTFWAINTRRNLLFVSRIRRKAGGPVSQPFYIINKLWDVKERTHCSQRVGHVVPGVVVYLDLCRRRSGWVRCDHNGLKRLPEAPLICWRPISPLWFLRNSALGCKVRKLAPFIYLSIYLSTLT